MCAMTKRQGYCKHEWHSAGLVEVNKLLMVVLYCRRCGLTAQSALRQ
jgi:hypothetical protein